MRGRARSALAGAGVWLLGCAAAGCLCGKLTTVFPISEAQYASLLSRFGAEALPDDECETLCRPAPTPTCAASGAAGGGAGGGAGGTTAAGGGTGGAATGGSGAGGIESGACIEPSESDQYASINECKLAKIRWTIPAVVCVGTAPCEG